jgi:hypothetical protein
VSEFMEVGRSHAGGRIGPAHLRGTQHFGCVLALLVQAAVVACQRARDVAALDVEVVAQDDAAIAQVGAQAEQVVLPRADQAGPERHDLHVAARARARHRILAEPALDVDHAQDELRVEPGALGLVLHRGEEIDARLLVGDVPGEPDRHLVQPLVPLVGGREHQPRAGTIGQRGVHGRLHARGKRLVLLVAGVRRRCAE